MIANITFPYTEQYFWHLEHTAPNREHRWGRWHFQYNSSSQSCDAWIVWQSHQGLRHPETRNCPPNKTILVLREPPDIIQLPPGYLKQFAYILSPDPRHRWHPGHLYYQFGQNWHIEKDYNELVVLEPPAKTRMISAVISNKEDTIGHRARLKFARAMKDYFGDQFDHFGRGVNPIKNKWDAVAHYQYHLTLENGQWPHYWTEKLVDAYLGWTLPLYNGAPNLTEYFDPQSFFQLDIEDIPQSLSSIEQLIAKDAWRKSLPHIREARKKLLNEYHLYRTLEHILESTPQTSWKPITLRPASDFSFPLSTRVKKKIRNIYHQLKKTS